MRPGQVPLYFLSVPLLLPDVLLSDQNYLIRRRLHYVPVEVWLWQSSFCKKGTHMIYWPEQQKGHFFKVMLKRYLTHPCTAKWRGVLPSLSALFILAPLSKSSLTIFSWPLWLATCKQETPFSTSLIYTKIGYSNLHEQVEGANWTCSRNAKLNNFIISFFFKLDSTLFNLLWLIVDISRKCLYIQALNFVVILNFWNRFLFPNFKTMYCFSSMIEWKLPYKLSYLIFVVVQYFFDYL